MAEGTPDRTTDAELVGDVSVGTVEVKNDEGDPIPVSGTVSVNEPVSVDDNGGSLTVDGPLTDAELRATAVPVDASGTPVPVTDNGGALTVDATDLDVRDLVETQDQVATVPGTGEVRDTVGDNTLPIKTAFIDVSTSGEHTLVAAVAGSKIRVISWRAQQKGASVQTISFLDGSAGAALTFPYDVGEREGAHATSQAPSFEFETSAGTALIVNLALAEATGVHVSYVEVP